MAGHSPVEELRKECGANSREGRNRDLGEQFGVPPWSTLTSRTTTSPACSGCNTELNHCSGSSAELGNEAPSFAAAHETICVPSITNAHGPIIYADFLYHKVRRDVQRREHNTQLVDLLPSLQVPWGEVLGVPRRLIGRQVIGRDARRNFG